MEKEEKKIIPKIEKKIKKIEIKDIIELKETIRKIIEKDLMLSLRTKKLFIQNISIEFAGVFGETRTQKLKFQLNAFDNGGDYYLEEKECYVAEEVKDDISKEIYDKTVAERQDKERQHKLITGLLNSVVYILKDELFHTRYPEYKDETWKILEGIQVGDEHSIKVMENKIIDMIDEIQDDFKMYLLDNPLEEKEE